MATINPKQIKNDHAQRSLELALDYKRQIDELVGQLPAQLRPRLTSAIAQIERWTANIYVLGQAIDMMERNATISRGEVKVPGAIDQLRQQERREGNAQKKLELNQAIATHEKLRAIETGIEKTHTRLDVTIGKLKEALQMIERLVEKTGNGPLNDASQRGPGGT